MESSEQCGMAGTHARSRTNIVVHVVWSTRYRVRVLPEERDAWLAALFARKAEKLLCSLLAAGIEPDHVHALVQLHSAVSLATLVARIKGASSRAWNLEVSTPSLAWQDGYWAESCYPQQINPLLEYLRDQRTHHARRNPPESWEREES